MSTYQQEMDVALNAAKKATHVALQHFKNDPKVQIKRDHSPVTEADVACENVIIQTIHASFPEDSILSEESGALTRNKRRRWIIDPIDGTKAFIAGHPFWGHLIALEEDRQIVVGCIGLPYFNEYFIGARKRGAFLNDTSLRVSELSELSKATLSLGQITFFLQGDYRDGAFDLMRQAWQVRCFGAYYASTLMLKGQIDIWMNPKAKIWDLAAVKLLMEEAGAIFTNFNNQDDIEQGTAIASNPSLHSQAIRILNGKK